MKKKLFSLLLASLMLVGAMAHHAFAEESDTSLADLQSRGEFVLGLDASFPPMGFADDNGNIIGYDIDLAAAVCEKLGVTLRCQPIDWDAKEMELNSGAIDCIWNGMSITPEREENMRLSIPYLKNDQVLVVRAKDGIAALSDLAGKNLGLQSGSSAEDALNAAADFMATLGAVLPYEDNTTALLDLDNGNVDAVLVDSVVAEYYIPVMGYDFVILEETLAGEEYGIGFRKADNALADAVNAALLEMAEDGAIEALDQKWFGGSASIIGAEQK